MWRRAIGLFKDCLFPTFCIECRKEGEWWCSECRIEKIQPFSWGAGDQLKRVTALFRYKESDPVGLLIKRYKYGYARDMEVLWTQLFKESGFEVSPNILIVPVPLHPRRQRERGFNQAAVFAHLLSKICSARVDDKHLIRVKKTAQQAKLSMADRAKNVANAFEWNSDVVPAKVLLVDDVYTTGATMQECAKALRTKGVGQITGFVLAHG